MIPKADFLKFLERCSENKTFCADFETDNMYETGYLHSSNDDLIKITKSLQIAEKHPSLAFFLGFLKENQNHFNHGQVNDEIKCLSKIVHKVEKDLGTEIANHVEDRIILLINNIKKEKLIPHFPCYYLRHLGFDNLEPASHLPLAQKLIELGKNAEVIKQIENLNIEKKEDRITIAKELLYSHGLNTKLMDKVAKVFEISESQLSGEGNSLGLYTSNSEIYPEMDNNSLSEEESLFSSTDSLSLSLTSEPRFEDVYPKNPTSKEEAVFTYNSTSEKDDDSNGLFPNDILETDPDCFSNCNEHIDEKSTNQKPLKEGIKLTTSKYSDTKIISTLKLGLTQWLTDEKNKENFKASLQKALDEYQPYLSNHFLGYLYPPCYTRKRAPKIRDFIKEVDNSNSILEIFCKITREGGWKNTSYNTLFLKNLVSQIIKDQKNNRLDKSTKADVISTIEINDRNDRLDNLLQNFAEDIAKHVQDYKTKFLT